MTYTQKSTQLSFHSSKKTFGESISKHIIWSFPLCQPSFWAPLFPGGTLWCHSLRWPGSSWLPLGSLGGMVRQPPGNVELGKLLGNSKDPKKKKPWKKWELSSQNNSYWSLSVFWLEEINFGCFFGSKLFSRDSLFPEDAHRWINHSP